VAALDTWLREQRSRLSRLSPVAEPIDYMLRRWDRFIRFLDDRRICLTNNAGLADVLARIDDHAYPQAP
jgi:hypothetical protein